MQNDNEQMNEQGNEVKEQEELYDIDHYIAGGDLDLSYGDKFTFFGIINEYASEIQKGWEKESTRKNNGSYYKRIISCIPEHNQKTIDEYTLTDLDAIVNRIATEGRVRKRSDEGNFSSYDPNTLREFRYLIDRVIKTAFKYQLTELDLEFTEYRPEPPEKGYGKGGGDSLSTRKILKRSFSVEEEVQLSSYLFSKRNDSSSKMGILIMFCLGTRNGEACGLTFGDFKKMHFYPSQTVCYIYDSTIAGSSEHQIGGKTSNAFRILPVSQKLYDKIQYWKRVTQEKYNIPDEKIDEAYIVHSDENAFDSLPARKLTERAKKMFLHLHYRLSDFSELIRDMENDEEEKEVLKKDPTAYLFRRNFATHLEILGLTDVEIKYLMGHTLRFTNLTRNDMSSEDNIYKIAQKLRRRPLVYDDFMVEEETIELKNNSIVTIISDKPKIELLPKTDGEVNIRAQTREPIDSLAVSVDIADEKIEKSVYGIPVEEHEYVNILKFYHQKYLEVLNRKKEIDDEVSEIEDQEMQDGVEQKEDTIE